MHRYRLLTSICLLLYLQLFFFNDTATTEIYTLSLHDALPILERVARGEEHDLGKVEVHLEIVVVERVVLLRIDRKSTRLNSSHLGISYAVFCLKKKKRNKSSSIFVNISIVPTRTRIL